MLFIKRPFKQFHEDDIQIFPTPHLLKNNFLSERTATRLIQEFPALSVITSTKRSNENNKRYSLSSKTILRSKKISPYWKKTLRQFTTQAFLNDVLRVFKSHIIKYYPYFEKDIGAFDKIKAGIRKIDTFDTVDILLDAQICINTPVTAASSVRRNHLDKANKLFFGLLYLRHPKDNSEGGALQLLKYNYFHVLEPITSIDYQRNTLVFVLNTPDAIHGVTERQITPYPRCFINFVFEVKQPLFTVDSYELAI